MCSCLTFTLQLSHVPHLHPTWGLSDILQACFSGCLLGLSFQRLCLITEGVSRITEFRSSHHGSVVMNLTGIHEDEDFVLFCFAFLGLCPQHMDVPRLGVESELQLLAYATVTDSYAGSRPHLQPNHSSQQHWILNPQSEARDRT